jgi:hypothetical protein
VKEGGVIFRVLLVPFLEKLQLLVTKKRLFVKKKTKNIVLSATSNTMYHLYGLQNYPNYVIARFAPYNVTINDAVSVTQQHLLFADVVTSQSGEV